jgi:predicted patatin/cPLA2 family phospholipase
MALTLLACGAWLGLAACLSVPARTPLPQSQADAAVALEQPEIRFWGDEPPSGMEEWFASSRQELATKHPALFRRPHTYLAMSGGGSDGAFGAGLLVGWTARGDRPEFTMVTGISTGALAAPFAFLGSDYDHVLREVYTTLTTDGVLKKRRFLGKLYKDGVASTEPLQALLARYIDEPLMQAIAAEYRRGRALYIGTTNLDAGRPVIWRIGRIADSGDPKALELIRRVLLASASIPAALTPVLLEVEAGGARYDEMHVDGGVTSQVFLYPVGIDWGRVLETLEVPGTPQVYVIRNSRLEPLWEETTNKVVPIATRSLSSLIRTQGLGDLYRIFLTTQRDGLDFNLAIIPPHFQESSKEMFDPEYMKKLFDLGHDMAREGYPWRKTPPEMEDVLSEGP